METLDAEQQLISGLQAVVLRMLYEPEARQIWSSRAVQRLCQPELRAVELMVWRYW